MPFAAQILLIGLAIGIYIGLLFMSRNGIKINGPMLLCAWLPCFIISIYLPAVYGFEIMLGHQHLFAPYQMWFLKISSYDFIQIAAGITLMAGLFTGNKQTVK